MLNGVWGRIIVRYDMAWINGRKDVWMTAACAMDPIPQAFLSMPLYIPLPRHPVTREKVSTPCHNAKVDVLKQFRPIEAIRTRAR